MASLLLKLSIFFILAVAAIAQCPAPQLPVVDLGYELHRAFSLNVGYDHLLDISMTLT